MRAVFLKNITFDEQNKNKFPMKQTILVLFSFLTLIIANPAYSQGFTPPSDSNAVVYFVRVSSYGGAVSFEFFDNQEFIGLFKGKNYMRYECPAGERLLWASSENKEFLRCDLKAGETYLVLVNIVMGAWKARVDLEPILPDNEDFERVKSVVYQKKPVVTPEAKIQKTKAKLDNRGFVENIMKRYEEEWKNTKATNTITADMFINVNQL